MLTFEERALFPDHIDHFKKVHRAQPSSFLSGMLQWSIKGAIDAIYHQNLKRLRLRLRLRLETVHYWIAFID